MSAYLTKYPAFACISIINLKVSVAIMMINILQKVASTEDAVDLFGNPGNNNLLGLEDVNLCRAVERVETLVK